MNKRDKLTISTIQLRFIMYIEKCNYILRSEVDLSMYPDSMIQVLLTKGLICQEGDKLTSCTSPL